MLSRLIQSRKKIPVTGRLSTVIVTPFCASGGKLICSRPSVPASLVASTAQGDLTSVAPITLYYLKTFDSLRDNGTDTPGGIYTDDVRYAFILPSGTMLTSNCFDFYGSSNPRNGALYRSTDWATAAVNAATFTLVKEFIKGGPQSWTLDGNANYAVAGTYGYNIAALNRDVWVSTDDGATWASCFHLEGDSVHIHMARIDPDGGCWITVGETSAHMGLWYASAESLTGTGGLSPVTNTTSGANDYGDFVKVYSGGVLRPIVALFHNTPDGKKYIYVGEDNFTNCINRIRYDDTVEDGYTRYDVENKYTHGSAQTMVGVSKITDALWMMVSAEGNAFVSRDYGEHWYLDTGYKITTAGQEVLCRTAHTTGMMYGGNPTDGTFKYRP